MSKKNCPICFSINPLLSTKCHCCFHVFNDSNILTYTSASTWMFPSEPKDDTSPLTFDELFTAYKELSKEKHKMGQKLNIALDALEFYANKNNWIGSFLTTDGTIISEDYECFASETEDFYIAGKLARETLEKIKKVVAL